LKLVVAVTGATGSPFAVRLLEVLRDHSIETHLVISPAGKRVMMTETERKPEDVEKLAHASYNFSDIGASIASGSFLHDGMIVIPCSMKTLAMISHGIADNLVTRAADVTLKEKRRLVLVPREAPLNVIHIRNMLRMAEMGVVVYPLVPQFYGKPASLEDMVDHFVGRILDLFGVEHEMFKRWTGGFG
jgi:4-hydroxy-3-polyprenylbenzoate decarboxylase